MIKKFLGLIMGLAIIMNLSLCSAGTYLYTADEEFDAAGNRIGAYYVAEGSFVLGDKDNRKDAENEAWKDAKRSAIEAAGTYVVAYSKVENYALTDNIVETISAGITRIRDQKTRFTFDSAGNQICKVYGMFYIADKDINDAIERERMYRDKKASSPYGTEIPKPVVRIQNRKVPYDSIRIWNPVGCWVGEVEDLIVDEDGYVVYSDYMIKKSISRSMGLRHKCGINPIEITAIDCYPRKDDGPFRMILVIRNSDAEKIRENPDLIANALVDVENDV